MLTFQAKLWSNYYYHIQRDQNKIEQLTQELEKAD